MTPERLELDEAGDLLLTAEAAAGLLGVALGDFLRDLRAGHVYSVIERGEGEDAGRLRAALRHRARECRLVLEAGSGRVLSIERGPGRVTSP